MFAVQKYMILAGRKTDRMSADIHDLHIYLLPMVDHITICFWVNTFPGYTVVYYYLMATILFFYQGKTWFIVNT